jgi:hypothetical protein
MHWIGKERGQDCTCRNRQAGSERTASHQLEEEEKHGPWKLEDAGPAAGGLMLIDARTHVAVVRSNQSEREGHPPTYNSTDAVLNTGGGFISCLSR